jgi:AbrB family looped-hinge helix DNA binding protein
MYYDRIMRNVGDEMNKRSTATVRERGQLTIPATVRKSAHLEEGAVVEFELLEEGVLLRPKIVVDDLHLDDDFVRSVIGATTDGYAAMRADEAAWAEEQAEREVLERTLTDGLTD